MFVVLFVSPRISVVWDSALGLCDFLLDQPLLTPKKTKRSVLHPVL